MALYRESCEVEARIALGTMVANQEGHGART